MMRMILVLVIFCCTEFVYGSSLQLKPYNETAVLMFFGNDPNLDGHIDRTEMRDLFRKYDADGNGIETRYEYTQYICATDSVLYQLSHYLFDEYDVNGDHVLVDEDYVALFDNMDIDPSDDQVTLGEFVHYWEVQPQLPVYYPRHYGEWGRRTIPTTPYKSYTHINQQITKEKELILRPGQKHY